MTAASMLSRHLTQDLPDILLTSASASVSVPLIQDHSWATNSAASKHQQVFCNNCGKPGHAFHHCKLPITSLGIIVFRVCPTDANRREYLMICRKDSLGYIDFMRGKYTLQNKEAILNMMKQMTVSEKEKLREKTFPALWKDVWGSEIDASQYRHEETSAKDKFASLKSGVIAKSDYYTLLSILDESNKYGQWVEPEWGFPKGRRDNLERDFECALREFREETGYSDHTLRPIQNMMPVEETFMGSNYKTYKHKYFVMAMDYHNSEVEPHQFDGGEVSQMEWKSYEECMACIRPYNLEKKNAIMHVEMSLSKFNWEAITAQLQPQAQSQM